MITVYDRLLFMKLFCACLFLFFSFISEAQIPAFTVTVFDSSSTGYYFFSDDQTKIITDHLGFVVYYSSNTGGNDFKLNSNGLMSYSFNLRYYFMDSTFNVVDSIEAKNLDDRDAHDMQVLPNGHFLLLGSDYETMDLSSYFFDGQFGSDTALVDCSVIQEQDENRNVVFEWHAKDYLVFSEADSFFLFQGYPIDWTHFNSVEMDTDGNILLSIRNFNEILKINYSDSSIMWRMGGSQNQFTFINCPVPFYGQHDVRRLPNGNITLFDNANNFIPHGARAMEFELDEINKIATLLWSHTYDSTMSSKSRGSTQRLSNGNTVVNYGNITSDSVCFEVVDTSGSKVFELDGLVSYRAFNYLSLPWQLHRPQITCFDSLGVTYLDAGEGYLSYKWSNGDSTRIIPIPASIDSYYVFVPYGEIGFISSEKFVISDTLNLCGALPVHQNNFENAETPKVFPNPASEKLTLTFHLSKKSGSDIFLSDVSGRKIIRTGYKWYAEGNHSVSFDISSLDAGFYFITLNQYTLKFSRQ